MNSKTTLIGGALAAILLSPGLANASFVLDTGTPTSTSGPAVFNPSGWYAAEFTVSAPENITSLSAYLTQGSQVGSAFTFDIYSSTNFLTTRVGSLSAVESATGTYSGTGWNTTDVNYTLAAGTYWLALQMTAVTEPRGSVQGLELPGAGLSAGSGTAPAQAFAFYQTSGTNGEYTTAGALPIGVQIAASPVPLPAAFWLLGSGLLGLGGVVRRRREAA